MDIDKSEKVFSLELFDLIIFYYLYELKSASMVASELKVNASKVSRSLASLRLALGEDLFIRTRYGFQPTKRTSEIIPKVSDLLNGILSIRDLSVSAKVEDRKVTVAMPHGVIAPLSELFSKINLEELEVKELRFVLSNDLSKMQIRTGEIDLLVSFEENICSELMAESLTVDDDIYFVASEESYFWFFSNEITPENLKRINIPLVSISRGGLNVEYFESVFESNGWWSPITYESDSFDEWYSQLLMTKGFAICSSLNVQSLSAYDGLRYEKIDNSKWNFSNKIFGGSELYLHQRRCENHKDLTKIRNELINGFSKLSLAHKIGT